MLFLGFAEAGLNAAASADHAQAADNVMRATTACSWRCIAPFNGSQRNRETPCKPYFAGVGFDIIPRSLATVFMLRAVPDLAAGILNFERPMPLG